MASKKQIILPCVVLLGGIASAIAFSSMQTPPQEKPEKIIHPLVEVSPIKTSPLQMSVSSYGIVKPKYSTQMVAQVSGQIIDLSDTFVKGGFVKKGAILARIDPNDYEAALIDAEANLAQASSALEIEQAQAHVAKTEWERIKNNANSTIPSELYLRKPQLAEKLARFQAAQASVKRAKRNLERTYIKAPYDAIIEARSLSLGSVVNQGSLVGVLNAISVAEVRLPVADNELQHLKNNGINAHVTLTAKVAGQEVNWSGTIVRSEGVIDSRSRMTYLVAQVERPYDDLNKPLRFGAYLNANIKGKLVDNAVEIPHHLVRDSQVAILNNDQTLSFKKLNIVREYDGLVVVDQGLESGQSLIVSALEYPTEGMQLRVDNDTLNQAATQLALKEE
ncbi:efflux transporter periplasmic adaptor subunit [Pseudoalteromonas luteoviolacea]|uniref:Efflux transporter periplasmic adaptor subunit n=1 Tax=Pseudoalteromonas luteoviolacea TaxID=43657 RepID=A0A1C0TW54_9GAMM|nr:efflux RND transporter periplasmic adaptor subunit [Pseudoalteromonas luteoviolacea]MBQ4810080.1 efflux RND transporter periplasmic adaptor subunit [Pseudoalteromonas luteoviolacea]OCQ23558.1 efflux transporter periplasmic adaptor subunit [Pseudoalteromonas luteoviolacea]